MKQLISCGRSSCSHSSMPQYVHTMWTTHLLRCLPNPAPQGHKALPHDHNAPTHCTLIIPHATNCSRFRKVQSGGERERKNRGEWGMGEILIPPMHLMEGVQNGDISGHQLKGGGNAIRNTQRTNIHSTTKFKTGEYFRLLEAVEQFYFDLVKIILNH